MDDSEIGDRNYATGRLYDKNTYRANPGMISIILSIYYTVNLPMDVPLFPRRFYTFDRPWHFGSFHMV